MVLVTLESKPIFPNMTVVTHIVEVVEDHQKCGSRGRPPDEVNEKKTDSLYFVIPLWRGSGYVTMFLQVQMPQMILTGLEDYKARGTQTSPYFTITYYKEFAETKNPVLIRRDIVLTSKLSNLEAKWLLETAQSFYLNDVRYKLVERFNKETRF
ncbi:hypothetical protein FEM48_Zijuj07G0167600 [Ziziphus jujuba var. spinosa]|uniref:Uncharacterized protein n=1 Tax=Ziziphus jujuba var. spinosa TaxID=714518 RepID=A0A978V5S9_ZIZJJ|nr:hypothetical protein FEM48_Zijuj07G0167600 [Ziziphus jujuba var. spinosa]